MHAVVLAPGDDAVCCLPYLHLVLEAKAYCSFLREEWSKQKQSRCQLSLVCLLALVLNAEAVGKCLWQGACV